MSTQQKLLLFILSCIVVVTAQDTLVLFQGYEGYTGCVDITLCTDNWEISGNWDEKIILHLGGAKTFHDTSEILGIANYRC